MGMLSCWEVKSVSLPGSKWGVQGGCARQHKQCVWTDVSGTASALGLEQVWSQCSLLEQGHPG